MSLKGIAKDTLRISDTGRYVSGGVTVDIAAAQRAAVLHTRVFTPSMCADLRAQQEGASVRPLPRITVSNEKTQVAARRLSAGARVALLDFASAKNVAGGFINGAKAQEEDLARCSGLYRCLETARVYYDANRACNTMLYTDHVVVAPHVPFFRVDGRKLLQTPYFATVLTAPAPNAGQHRRKSEDTAVAEAEIAATLMRRARNVVAIAATLPIETLILGAWGCGVFMNDPSAVAEAFYTVLVDEGAGHAFKHVHFAVYERTDRGNHRAFAERFDAVAR